MTDIRHECFGLMKQVCSPVGVHPEFLNVKPEAASPFDDARRRCEERPNKVRANAEIMRLAKFCADGLRADVPSGFRLDDPNDVVGT